MKNQWKNTQQQWHSQNMPQQEMGSQPAYWQHSYYNNPQSHPYQEETTTNFPQSNTNYDHQLGNTQYSHQYNSQNNMYSQQNPQHTEGADWENWGWGDEDNSNNIQSFPQQNSNVAEHGSGFNLTESFTNDEAWNWSLEESAKATTQHLSKPEDSNQEFQKFSQVSSPNSLKSDSGIDTIRPSVDHLSVGRKHNKLETPQWSVESQLSQESSDDILQTSESDKSHILSRSSTISHSPIPALDPSPFGGHNIEDVALKQESNDYEENVGAFGSQNYSENKENLSGIVKDVQEPKPSKPVMPPPSKLIAPVPSSSSNNVPLNPYKQAIGLSHKSGSKFRYANISQIDKQPSLFQPFNQSVNLETLPDNSEQPDSILHVPLSRKPPIPKSSQQWQENSEIPINDRNQYLETGRLSDVDLPDMTQNDRSNQQEGNDTLPPPGLRRMVLGQIEQDSTSTRNDQPPPGLSRMVLGQTENTLSSIGQTTDLLRQSFDPIEPPEGLHRMVPGESSSPESASRQQQYQSDRQQEDDSETEFNQIAAHIGEPRSATIGADTPPTVSNPLSTQAVVNTTNRSETIGADTPPIVNKISQDNDRARPISNEGRVGAVGVDASERKKKDASQKKHDHSQKNMGENSRRDTIEGKSEHTMASLVNSIRNLTVGENTLDEIAGNDSDQNHKHSSRLESSDSEPELKGKLSRDYRERRYRDKDDKHDLSDRREKDDRHANDSRRDRDRYSPDAYRDHRHNSKRRYKDKRYDDDTDYYSDKEKDRHPRGDKDYDRVYYSLRKDKERRRKEPREYPRSERDYRRNEYYSKYEDEYLNDSRSRPSSRSDSMHESYRERHDRDYGRRDKEHHRHHDTDRRRRHRDPFAPYSQGFGYDPYSQYYQQYQYYEQLRRTNPQAYAELYRKYYQQTASQTPYGTEDRASVHSGRSSANDEMMKDRSLHNFDNTESSTQLEDTSGAAQRLTPAKFATAHTKASICSGRLVKVLPHYPLDGQSPTVELCHMESLLLNNDEYREITLFPGPLMKGVTHKKTVIEYCENKIKGAIHNADIVDPESYILMWELLILLLRQNGMVVGTDIAELLLKNRNVEMFQRPSSVMSSISSNAAEINITSETSNQPLSEATNGSMMSILKEEEVTNKFREYLLYGSCKEALEWAMKHGLWGHALFLASKLDKRTYANVMMRFANGLTMNDPLQTLYQLLSGRTPACVTCIADEKWGDWRPHLAMILSNPTHRPEFNCKAVTTLGDTLMSRGSLYAAQFCYLMAEVGFSRYGEASAKLVLLGANHTKNFQQFATNEAIHMTEIYEYACSLNDSAFVIPEFQVYKYLLATRLADYGELEKSLAYLEKVAGYLMQSPASVHPNLINNVCILADRLKYCDLVGDVEDSEFGENINANRPDNSWLRDLKNVQYNYNLGVINYPENDDANYTANNLENNSLPVDTTLQTASDSMNFQQDTWQEKQTAEQYVDDQQSAQQSQFGFQDQPVVQDPYSMQYQNQQQHQQQYWSNQTQWNQTDQLNQYNNQEGANHQQQEFEQHQQSYYGANTQTEDVPAQPQISMPNQSQLRSAYNDEEPKSSKSQENSSPVKPKPEKPQSEKPASTGWFGGIFSRLAPKPKNQMKLPDDKNPTIVWDPVKKRWINNDDDGSNGSNEFKPPPKMSDLMPKSQLPTLQGPGINQIQQPIPMYQPEPNSDHMNFNNVHSNVGESSGAASLPTTWSTAQPGTDSTTQKLAQAQPNMFKLHGRSRNLKKSYIDVFNPGGGKSSAPMSLPNPDVMNIPNNSSAQQMNFFIPQPVNDPNLPVDFLTPAQQFDENSQLSRWSSASSLSREVQSYMMHKPHPIPPR